MWATNNPLSGGPCPRRVQGLRKRPVHPTCGGTWTSRPGNSSNPPATIPTDMAVVVSTHIIKNGSTITGDVAHIVVVHINPGYIADPGDPGTATVIGILC